ncbi:MAG: MBL fold metallo-hydrolase [Anaerolineales bacterium]|nr:MBL fold metallo-hydrolase [Anaerolineales bacterium]MCB8952883.1 MBL fold metallo-hydrolase [Ardenticatenales bacterium]
MHIETLDLAFQHTPQTIAAYLIEGPAGMVLVETGPGSTRHTLVDHLRQRHLQPRDLQAIIVTHIHLDHAGAAGWFAQQGVPVYVHYVGAPHLIDPTRLLSSAARIYGDQMDTLWGEMLPAPADCVHALHDGDTITAGGLTFMAMHTPGHASHHHVICLGDIAFVGDAGGIHLPGTDFVDLPAPPPEFDREAWRQTIQKLMDAGFAGIYPTHFGLVTNPRAHFQAIGQLIDQAVTFIDARLQANMPRDQLVSEYVNWIHQSATAHHLSEDLFHRYAIANPHYMSVDGITRYLRRRQKSS